MRRRPTGAAPPRRTRWRLLAVVVVALAAACAVIAFEMAGDGRGDTLAAPGEEGHPAPRSPDVSGVSYGPHAQQVLDLFLPGGSTEGSRPLIVYVHGGGWVWGSRVEIRCDNPDPAIKLCIPSTEIDRGYVVASIDYRLFVESSGENPFPSQVKDVKLAVAWLRAHAPEYGIDPDRVVLMGHSSGGHLAALAALSPGEWEPPSVARTTVDGFVSLVGPADLATWVPWLDAHGQPELAASTYRAAGCEDSEVCAGLENAAPLSWVDPAGQADDPPGYLYCEEGDPFVPCEQAIALRDALVASHGDTAVVMDIREGADDDPHNPDYDLDLTALRSFIDGAVS